MAYKQLKQGIYSVGVIDWDRSIFDELIPLPDGTSYNAYLIYGSDKVALVDTVDPTKGKELVANLRELGLAKLDYIIANHAEQDHSGTIPEILRLYPDAMVVTNPKCKAILMDLMPIPESRFMTVNDGDTISLGDRTLEFIIAPWVHWPETMFTYLKEDRILFTCDFLGSHLATSELFAGDQTKVYPAAKRYYAEIMMPFRAHINKHIEKISSLDVDIVAPSHGPLYDNPRFIIENYREWASDRVKGEVIILYVSMHGSTAGMAEYIIDKLIKHNLPVKPFNLTKADVGELAMALVDAATLVIAAPTVLAGAHPAAVYAACLINALKPKTRYISIVGSYGWGGRMVEQLEGLMGNIKAERLEPVIVKGCAREEDYRLLDRLVEDIIKKNEGLKEEYK